MGAGLFGGFKLLRWVLGIVTIEIVAGAAAAGAGDVVGPRAADSDLVPARVGRNRLFRRSAADGGQGRARYAILPVVCG